MQLAFILPTDCIRKDVTTYLLASFTYPATSTEPLSGAFVALFDHATLALYLREGVYATHLPLVDSHGIPGRAHWGTAADYACLRPGSHIFFFLKRELVYGGEVVGPAAGPAFFLNGQSSPAGAAAGAPLCWDESTRGSYAHIMPGVFRRPSLAGPAGEVQVAQPYLIRFEDRLGLQGRFIRSDDLYFELGDFPFPLPSNSMQGMTFCILTPAEVEIALDLLQRSGRKRHDECPDDTTLKGEPLPFDLRSLPSEARDCTSEAQLEFAAAANPPLLWQHLPRDLVPSACSVARQVPISPFKSYQMDRADLCFFHQPAVLRGAIPNLIVELKAKRAGSAEVEQIDRYLLWLRKRLLQEADGIQLVLFAPSFARTVRPLAHWGDQVRLVSYDA